jgi:hypothetical protein
MSVLRPLLILTAVIVVSIMSAAPAFALPTMIRIGYAGCASCHYSPQGGGPLNPYGRGIDEAQSLRAGEYQPRQSDFVKAISWGGRITQDVRVVMVAAHQQAGQFRPRLQYRNVTELPRGFAVHFAVMGETDPVPRPGRDYDPAVRPESPLLNVALLRYTPKPGIEIAAGRDQLPSGVNMPNLGLFIKSRNRQGVYDTPVQVKANWSGKRHQITPFAYGPSGYEASGERESGAGTLAEFDVLGRGTTVVGMSYLRGRADNGDRQTLGAYTRLGFGSWGILAQHDVTDRSREGPEDVSFRQHASYGQVFWAAREWLVFSAVGERLDVERPFRERLAGGSFEVAARLTSVATIGVSAGVQRNLMTDRISRSVALQLALKSVY